MRKRLEREKRNIYLSLTERIFENGKKNKNETN